MPRGERIAKPAEGGRSAMSEALTPLAIRCLGPPSVRVDGHDAPPDVVWRKHLALLVYLALSPDTTRARAHLVGLLWAESPDDKARRSLNEAVRRLRTALGEERLLNRGDGLQLSTAALQRDLGGQPSPQLSALANRVRESKWQRPRGRHPDPEPPLIGRRNSHARLFAELERMPREGSTCLVITGEPGSGRTRLLDACAERLALAGAWVATARILQSDHDAPWSTLRALMRGGLLESPGIAATDHLGLRILAGLVPELAARVQALEPHDVAQVSDALASFLHAVSDEQPVAVLIDDAQWADGATLAALRAAWSRERRTPLALVLTLEPGGEL